MISKFEKELHGNYGAMAQAEPRVKLQKSERKSVVLTGLVLAGFWIFVSHATEIAEWLGKLAGF